MLEPGSFCPYLLGLAIETAALSTPSRLALPVTRPANPRLRVRRKPPPPVQDSSRRNLVLAVVVLAVGLGTAFFGYWFGQRALEDVTSPTPVVQDERKLLGRSQGLLKEEDILATVASVPTGEISQDELFELQEEAVANSSAEDAAKLTIAAEAMDQDVSLKVDSVLWQGSNLVLQVSLQNRGRNPVRFVYSPTFDLLVVSDPQGNPLRTYTEGLPADLPDDQEVYRGTIQVSASDLEGVESLNLSLTDYPDRALTLNLRTIPVPALPGG